MTTATKYRLPPLETFMQYAPITRHNLMAGYHRKLTAKHRWFVRGNGDHYYCDGEIPTDPYVDIFDCNWTPDAWATVPYRYYHSTIADSTFAYYAKPGLPPLVEYGYGYTREDVLETRDGEHYFVYFAYGTTFVWWHPNDASRALKVEHDGLYTQVHADGSFTQGTFGHQNVVKAVVSDPLIAAIKYMRHKRYSGFYNDLIAEIIRRFDVPANRL